MENGHLRQSHSILHTYKIQTVREDTILMNPYYDINPTPSGNLRTSISSTADYANGSDDNNWWENNSMNLAKAGLGAASLATGWYGMSRQGLGLGQLEQPSTDGYSGAYLNAAFNAHPQKTNGVEILGGAAKGAAIGTQFAPGIGTAVGAGVGALGTIFAGRSRRLRQERERDRAISQALNYQSAYNNAQTSSDQRYTSAADYQRRLDKYNQNLYSWTSI